MSTKALCAALWCTSCNEETPHVVLYAGHYIKSISCSICQHTLLRPQATIRRQYVHDFPRRAVGLARRTIDEARQHPVDFLKHLPRRAVLKPLEISSELYDILNDPAETA